MKKIHIVGLVFTILAFVMVLSLTGCVGNGSNGLYPENFNGMTMINIQDVKPLPDNYRITQKVDVRISGTNHTATMSEMRCEEGFVITGYPESSDNDSLDDYSITFFDTKNAKVYRLNPIEKIGIIMPDNGETIKSNFDVVTEDYYGVNVGHEKIAGRNAVVYEYEDSISMWGKKEKMKYWIDEEYGILLKSHLPAQVDGKKTVWSEEVTEFKIGGCKLTDMVNLSEYTLTDMSSFS
jgi:Negative regulator of sigma E activity